MPSIRPGGHRRILSWPLLAASLSVLAHAWLLHRLWYYQPVPWSPPPPLPPSEWSVQFEPMPPAVARPAPIPAAVAPPPVAAAERRRTRRPAPARSVAAPTESEPEPRRGQPLAEVPELAIPAEAWDGGREARRGFGPGRSTDQLLPGGATDPDFGPGQRDRGRQVRRTAAGIGGAPTRTDAAATGDIHSAMLFDRWNDQHHGSEFRGCAARNPAEPLSSWLERCGPGR